MAEKEAEKDSPLPVFNGEEERLSYTRRGNGSLSKKESTEEMPRQ